MNTPRSRASSSRRERPSRRQGAGGKSRVVVSAHAKINLNLRVLGLRADGYHGLQTVFQTLAWRDTLTLESHDGPFTLTCADPRVPVDGRNLIVKAAAAVWHASGRLGEPHGVRVHLRKRIPMQGGLGGGSSNAAAALVALDAFWHAGLDASQRMAMAKCLGADVPFFLCGGTALGLDRGDDIYPLEEIRPVSLVLVFPPFGVATPEAFRWFDEDQAVGGTDGLAAAGGAALPEQRLASAWGALPVFNDLEAPVRRRHPEIGDLVRRLIRDGATAAAMTGSGSTVFGIFPSSGRAREVANRLGRAGWQAVATRTAARQNANPSSNLVWKRFSRID